MFSNRIPTMADIIFISPRFKDCFWGLDLAMPLVAKRASLPQACLPLLAALTPAEHRVTLIDENIEEIDYERCARADIVGVTGMNVQRFQMTRILGELKKRECFTAVGGAWITVEEDYFGPLVDVIFIGEADDSWPRFLQEWKEGRASARYEQSAKTDLTKAPVPRFDLLKTRHYFFGTLQFSRGCPHRCEFCDIIVVFGRRPRYKTPAQVIAEMEAVFRSGQRLIFVVDDNLICDKAALRAILREMIVWQQKNGYPLGMITQVTLDLSDDPELMGMMVEANFVGLFIGVESPSVESLQETGKWHNLRNDEPLIAKLHRIQRAGFVVWCGMIQGFDHDDPSIFRRQLEFLTDGRIPIVMSGMLAAIPKTPLFDRVAREGRLDRADPPRFGTNIVPAGMTSKDLRDGYIGLHYALYDPDSYFKRLEALFLDPEFEVGFARQTDYWGRHRWLRLRREAGYALKAAGLFLGLTFRVPEASLRREYRRRIRRLLKVHRRPGLVLNYLIHIDMQYHAWALARKMAEGRMPVVNTY